uniref:Uncharacterized protein n=1 Tax=Anopheles minimus TaxID=112268 RepID=A0A182W2H4_9DIPT
MYRLLQFAQPLHHCVQAGAGKPIVALGQGKATQVRTLFSHQHQYTVGDRRCRQVYPGEGRIEQQPGQFLIMEAFVNAHNVQKDGILNQCRQQLDILDVFVEV